MSKFVFSNEPCCFRCSHFRCNVGRNGKVEYYCNRYGCAVKGWYAACEHFNEICGRFGGWTVEVMEEPQPFKG